MARVGQMLLNNGTWLDGNHTPYQMLEPSYIKEMYTVQHPEWANATTNATANAKTCSECAMYSLLSYVMTNNTPVAEHESVCRPWNESLGHMKVPHLPNGTLLAIGSLARMMMVGHASLT